MADTEIAGGGTDVIDAELEQLLNGELTEDGDHDRFSHYAPKAQIMEALVTGVPIVALCGKKWVPSRDPERFPVCPTCKEIYESLHE